MQEQTNTIGRDSGGVGSPPKDSAFAAASRSGSGLPLQTAAGAADDSAASVAGRGFPC